MIVLDTDILSIIQFGEGAAYEHLVQRLDERQDEPIVVSIVSYEEQLRGWLAYAASAKSIGKYVHAMERLRIMLDDYGSRSVIDFDSKAAVEFQRLAKLKLRIGTMDLRIASIAISNSALLVSRNLADFRRVPGLRVEDWTRQKN